MAEQMLNELGNPSKEEIEIASLRAGCYRKVQKLPKDDVLIVSNILDSLIEKL